LAKELRAGASVLHGITVYSQPFTDALFAAVEDVQAELTQLYVKSLTTHLTENRSLQTEDPHTVNTTRTHPSTVVGSFDP